MMTSLAASLLVTACTQTETAETYTLVDAREGAEFRQVASGIVAVLDRSCPLSRDPALTSLYTAPESRFANLKARLDGTNHGVDLAIAEADFAHQMEQVFFECAEPDRDDSAEEIQREVAETMASIVELETLTNHGIGKGA